MDRRTFLQAPLAAALSAAPVGDSPSYRVVTSHKPSARPGMPGEFPGRVVSVHSERSIDDKTGKADAAVVREMLARGMTTLTGSAKPEESWQHFFRAEDVVGIKVNCSGAPDVCSNPAVVAEIVRNLTTAAGVKPSNIYIYERFVGQMDSVAYDRST